MKYARNSAHIVNLIGAMALACLPSAAAACADEPMPVQVGNNDDLDACGSTGKITGHLLSVRATPDAKGSQTARLAKGKIVQICDESADSQWIGIVYAPAAKPDMDCGVGTPISPRRDYDGPCRSGWVAARYVQVIAG